MTTDMPEWWYMANAFEQEFPRVAAWHERHNPETGRRRSWLEAMWSVAENPPTFDALWDQEFEAISPPHDADGAHCWCCPDIVYTDGSHAPGPCLPGETLEAPAP